MAPETIQIHPKSIPGARPRKKQKKVRKSDAPDSSPAYRFWTKSAPKWHLKTIKNSIPKKYAKMMAKGSKSDGKWSRNGIQNHENQYKVRSRKSHRKNIEKNVTK